MLDLARGSARFRRRNVRVNDRHASAEQRDRVQQVVDDDRLEDVELEIALRAGEADGRVVADHLHAYHRHRLGLRRIDLARHDRRPRLVLRQRQFAQAAARTGAHPADVVGDLHQRAGQRLERAASHHQARRAPPGPRTCSAPTRTASPVSLRDSRGHALGELGMRIQAGADGGAAERQLVDVGQHFADARRGPRSSWAT